MSVARDEAKDHRNMNRRRFIKGAIGTAVMKAHQSQTDVAVISAYCDYREMLEKEGERIDAVVIATPNHRHASAVVFAMPRGVHVYVEKPMALTIDEVNLMDAVVKRHGNVAARAGLKKLSWDGRRVTNNPAVNGSLKTTCRDGWGITMRF